VTRPGAFEWARNGVLMLDEIGETSPAVQAKLLRVLETGELWRLGGRKAIPIDIRLVTATCADLRHSIDKSGFRLDLLHRIDTLVLELPPLRERREDLAELADGFALQASHGKVSVGNDALHKLMDYSWPGNVRELRNVIHRALVFADGADELCEEHITF
jgi:transcriptional regulator with GAF, ATPase, and Fis domain